MKDRLRSEAKNRLRTMTSAERQQASLQIQQSLKSYLQEQSGIWAGYQALSDEPSINWSDVSEKISWVFPVSGADRQLIFKTATSGLAQSDLGVNEPLNGETVELKDISGVVLPALGFDQRGYRLGRGGGYYDRTLTDYTGQKLGLCFETNFLKNLPDEPHDVRCHPVFTEKNVYHTEGVLLCKSY